MAPQSRPSGTGTGSANNNASSTLLSSSSTTTSTKKQARARKKAEKKRLREEKLKEEEKERSERERLMAEGILPEFDANAAAAAIAEAAGVAATANAATSAASGDDDETKKEEKDRSSKAEPTQQPHVQPNIAHLTLLPYVSDLSDPAPELLQLLLDEHTAHRSVLSAERSYDTAKNSKSKKKLDHELVDLPRKTLLAARAALTELSDKVDRSIDRHYRKTSIRLHPDRNGEACRPSFERLTESRDCLRDGTRRRLYVEQMLSVVTMKVPKLVQSRAEVAGGQFIGRELAQSSHDAWVAKNGRGGGGGGSGGGGGAGGNNREHTTDCNSDGGDYAADYGRPLLQLQGGIYNDQPRKPRVQILSADHRQVEVAMPLPDDDDKEYLFLRYCRKMHVVIDAGFLDEEIIIATVDLGDSDDADAKSARMVKFGTVDTIVTLPEEGLWSVRWFATLCIDGTETRTPSSHEATVDVTSERTRRMRREWDTLNELARSRAGQVQSVLRSFRHHNPHRNNSDNNNDPKSDVEAKYWRLHSALARARSTENRIRQLGIAIGAMSDEHNHDGNNNNNSSSNSSSVNNNNSNATTGLTLLRAAIDLAQPVKLTLEHALATRTKSTALRTFKSHVANLIECGTASDWISTVTASELRKMGGEVNRLYQLLVEGRGRQFALELDGAILGAAAGRTDLFTAKQCEALTKRTGEVEEMAKLESERVKDEAEQKKKVEKERAEAEERALKARAWREAELKAFRESAERLRRSGNDQSQSSHDANDGDATDNTMLFPPGTRVMIHSIVRMEVLNGTAGTVEGPDPNKGGRVVVDCEADGRLRSLAIGNLMALGGGGGGGGGRTAHANHDDATNVPHADDGVFNDDGAIENAKVKAEAANAKNMGGGGGNFGSFGSDWTCSACTYRNEGANAHAEECQVCDTPKSASVGASNVAIATADKATEATTAEDRNSPHMMKQPVPKSQAAAAAAAAAAATPSKKVDANKGQVAAAAAAAVKTRQAPKSPKRTEASRAQPQQQQQQNHQQPIQPTNHQQQLHRTRPCQHGARCRFLPNNCRFYHDPREIEEAARRRPPGHPGHGPHGSHGTHGHGHASGSSSNYVTRKAKLAPAVIGTVIGYGGSNVEMVKRRSGGAKVWIDQETMGPHEMRIASVSGTPDRVERALDLIRDLATREAPMGDANSFVLVDERGGRTTGSSSGSSNGGTTVASSTVSPRQKEIVAASAPTSTPAPTPTPAPTQASAPAPSPLEKARNMTSPVRADEAAVGAEPTVVPQQVRLVPVAGAENPIIQPNPPMVGGSLLPLRMQDSNRQGLLSEESAAASPDKQISDLQRLNATSSPVGSPALVEDYQSIGIAPPISPPVPYAGDSGQQYQALMAFLESNKSCLKGSTADFGSWLVESEDIATLADLADAVSDDDYLHGVLQPGNGKVGVKGFKRAAFKKAVVAVASSSSSGGDADDRDSGDVPTELVCPITQQLMTDDPVLASDGHTYERSAIEAWFDRQRKELALAAMEVNADPSSQRGRAILERGVLSPVTHTKMDNLTLIPNHAIRTMARDSERASYGVYA